MPDSPALSKLSDHFQSIHTPVSFQVGDRALDAAALNAIWDGLDRVDSHFWEVEELERWKRSAASQASPPRTKPWWKVWAQAAD